MSGVALAAIASVVFAAYAVALATFFSREHGVDWRMSLLKWLGLAAAVVHVVTIARGGPRPAAAGLLACALYVAGLAVFAAACSATRARRLTLAFSPDVPTTLVRDGIYRHLRHPFYTAYALAWLAGCVAAPRAATIVTCIAMLGMYVWAAVVEERKFVGSALEPAYRLYRSEVGAFVPRLRSPRGDARLP